MSGVLCLKARYDSGDRDNSDNSNNSDNLDTDVKMNNEICKLLSSRPRRKVKGLLDMVTLPEYTDNLPIGYQNTIFFLHYEYYKIESHLIKEYQNNYDGFMSIKTVNVYTGEKLKPGMCVHAGYKCLFCKLLITCRHVEPSITCKLCRPSLLCIHYRNKYKCIGCNTRYVCVHNSYIYKCVTCKVKPSMQCVHSIKKRKCEMCTVGWNICKHSMLKYACKECSDETFCLHLKPTFYCDECNPKTQNSKIVNDKKRKL